MQCEVGFSILVLLHFLLATLRLFSVSADRVAAVQRHGLKLSVIERFVPHDRIVHGLPGRDEEIEVVERTTSGTLPEVTPVLSRDALLDLQALVRRLPTSRDVHRYAVLYGHRHLERAPSPEAEAVGFFFVDVSDQIEVYRSCFLLF